MVVCFLGLAAVLLASPASVLGGPSKRAAIAVQPQPLEEATHVKEQWLGKAFRRLQPAGRHHRQLLVRLSAEFLLVWISEALFSAFLRAEGEKRQVVAGSGGGAAPDEAEDVPPDPVNTMKEYSASSGIIWHTLLGLAGGIGLALGHQALATREPKILPTDLMKIKEFEGRFYAMVQECQIAKSEIERLKAENHSMREALARN